MLDDSSVADGCARHDGWVERSWEGQQKAAVVGSVGASHESIARRPSYVLVTQAGPCGSAVD
jgi:hypothetical protein